MNRDLYEQYEVNSALERERSDKQMAMYAPQIKEQMDESKTRLLQQTDPEKIVTYLILKLKGMKEDQNGDLIKVGEPMMNQLGIDTVDFYLSPISNLNTTLSRLKSHEIAKIILHIADDILLDLALNWRKYGIKERTMLNKISDGIIIPSLLTLKRAEEQNEKNWLGRIVFESINNNQQIQKPKDNFLSKFKL